MNFFESAISDSVLCFELYNIVASYWQNPTPGPPDLLGHASQEEESQTGILAMAKMIPFPSLATANPADSTQDAPGKTSCTTWPGLDKICSSTIFNLLFALVFLS